jgi:hypothetical protein
VARGLLDGYYFDHFRRDRYAFSDNRAVNSAFGAFDSAASVYKFWVRQSFTQNTNGNSQALATYKLDPLMQDTWSMAAFDGINNLLDVMSVPPAGYHGKVPANQTSLACSNCWTSLNEGDEFRNLDAEGRASTEAYYKGYYQLQDFGHLPRGSGRATYSRYDFRSGFGFWNRLVEVGYYNDQFAAMFAAVMPEVYFLDADDTADRRRYNVPYYLIFNKELSEVFGATWSNDEAYRRPTIYVKTPAKDAAGNVCTGSLCATPAVLDVAYKRNITPENYVDWGKNGAGVPFRYVTTKEFTTAEATAAKAVPGNVQTTWTARIYSIYLGMALFSVNYDLDYSKANQVFKVGAGEAIPSNLIPNGYAATCVDDPFSGHQYCAVQATGQTRDTPAVRMIKEAQADRNAWSGATGATKSYWADVFKDDTRDLDMMRGMYAVYGKAF